MHRSHLSDDTYRVYLAPMGKGDLKEAYERILNDAHSHGKKAKFHTLTKTGMKFLYQEFYDCFDITENRDLSEYIFEKETFETFSGKKHARRRTEIRSFWRDYGERTEAVLMGPKDGDEVFHFTEKWLRANAQTHDEAALRKELICIKKQLENYNLLGLSGTILRIDGKIRGYCYGVPLNDAYYDVLIEKGDRRYPGIYRVIRQESTKLNLSGFSYVNFEEDVGEAGLRKLKESYGPAFMIDKYIATEK